MLSRRISPVKSRSLWHDRRRCRCPGAPRCEDTREWFFLPIYFSFISSRYFSVYFLLPFKWKGLYVKNTFITIISYVFYGWLVPWFVMLMFITTINDYICGQIISHPGQVQWKRKAALVFAIVTDIGLLVYFKYYMFFMGEVVNGIVAVFGGGAQSFSHRLVLCLREYPFTPSWR